MELRDVVLSHEDTECTAYPYWCIVSPLRNGRYQMLDGVWFNRPDAELFLKRHAYNYPKDATVFCFSGNRSDHMKRVYEMKESEELRERYKKYDALFDAIRVFDGDWEHVNEALVDLIAEIKEEDAVICENPKFGPDGMWCAEAIRASVTVKG